VSVFDRGILEGEKEGNRERWGGEPEAEVFPAVPRPPASVDEVIAISTLSHQLFPEQPWDRIAVEEEMARRDGWVRVLVDGCGGLVGYLLARTGVDEVQILQIGVSPAFQGRGHGRLLLRRFLDEVDASGIPMVSLEVRSSNRVARKLYLGEGFRRVGIRRAYYRRPVDDALLMTRPRP